jgi:uncharacterized protein
MDYRTEMIELVRKELNNPLVILGFVEETSLGLLTSSYIIESLNMHQIAQIRSRYIPPVTVFVGKKMRSPFRLYSNGEGNLLLVTCDVPVDPIGLHEVSSVLVDWLESKNAKEVVVVEGIPVRGYPEDRTVFVAAEENNIDKFLKKGLKSAESAIIGGLGGAVINVSIGKRLNPVSIMAPASVTLQDPAAVLSIINVLNDIYDLKVNVEILEESVNRLNEEIKKIMDQYTKMQLPKSSKDNEPPIYG